MPGNSVSGRRPVHEYVAEWARQTPEATAVECAGDSLTYRDLNSLANQLAHKLISMGVGVEARVGLYMERSLEMVVAMLGILRAGAAYVPLEASDPPDRLRFVAEDARLSVVLVDTGLSHRPWNREIPYVPFGSDARSILAGYANSAPQVEVNPSSLAYVIYTSGSTGRPKGVGVPPPRFRELRHIGYRELRARRGCAFAGPWLRGGGYERD